MQAEVLASNAPTIALVGGARAGKTWTGFAWSLSRALAHPCHGMIVSATIPAQKISVIPYLDEFRAKTGIYWSWNRNDGEIRLPNGSVIWLRSAQVPESILGAGLAWLWGDEVGQWRREAWQFAIGRLSEVGPWKQQVLVTFTPKGLGWAHQEFGSERDGLHLVRTTTADNRALPPSYIERLRTEYGEGSAMWRQEVLGEWIAHEGLVYPEFSIETCVADPGDDAQIIGLVGGVDWGWSNPGCILVVGLDTEGVMWVLEETYATQRSIDQWAADATGIGRRRGVRQWHCDPSEPEHIARFQRHRLTALRAHNDVLPGITAVASRFAQGKLKVSPSCANLIRELGAYTWKTRADELVTDEPQKVNDHAVDALRYAVLGIARQQRAERVKQGPRDL